MTDAFEEITASLIVSSWHAAWRSAQLRLHTHNPDHFTTAIDIGRAALDSFPATEVQGALDELFNAYWRVMADQDIRNSLEDDEDPAGFGVLPMREAIDKARAAGEDTVTVSRDDLARVLERFDDLRLHRRYCRADQDEEQDGTG